MSLQSQPPGVGHTEGTGPLRWIRSQEPSGTRRSHLHPTGSARLQTQLRFTEPGAGVGGSRRSAERGSHSPGAAATDAGRRGLCPVQGSPVPIPNGGGHGLHASRSESLGQKVPGLGKRCPVPPGPWSQAEVPGDVLAKILPPWCLSHASPSPLPPRHAFRQEDRPCYRLVDLRTSRLPCVLRLPLWEGRKCGQSETCAGGALRGPRSDPASTVQWPQARQFQLPSRLSHGALPETISPAPLVPSLTVDLEKSTPCLLHWASRVS